MRVFSLATWSWQFHAEFHVLRGTQDTASSSDFFAYGTITRYGRSFQRHSAKIRFFYSTYAVLQPRRASTTVWALPISLATTFGISVDFFSSGYWDVSLHRVVLLNLFWISVKDFLYYYRKGFPIRKSPDQRLFAPPRRLSQLTTSFIGFICQGIHCTPFTTWPYYLVSHISVWFKTLFYPISSHSESRIF